MVSSIPLYRFRDESSDASFQLPSDHGHSSCGASIAKAFAAGGWVKRRQAEFTLGLDQPIGPMDG